ncbi:Bax inhibitor-1/YccA family protein [Candidatus Tachikawaea gelatinosa]|uniref:Inner membrane protein YbhL n=1 Tax=Candidatus Tachikawaea gelatinosa TaxID=1410383 RepID=A0A090ALU5_9ENTR|nr:Bax inhibitor-1/YccA family protein [Candidatus Tachikawaea gelatinosa]BAP58629.1 putative uncharacterized protein [Candidatus Tachikawaea gelatinosa]
MNFKQIIKDSIIEQNTSSNLKVYLNQVYGWMTCGLLLTAFVSFYLAKYSSFLQIVYTHPYIIISLVIVQLITFIILSSFITKLNSTLLTAGFMFYSFITGVTITSIFSAYHYYDIANAFFITASMFGVTSIYGYTTKSNLGRFSNTLIMALTGIIIASITNIFLKNSILYLIINYVSVVVFIVLIAYDTQLLKKISEEVDFQDPSSIRRYSIYGALRLYLDFINLFLTVLKITGDRK